MWFGSRSDGQTGADQLKAANDCGACSGEQCANKSAQIQILVALPIDRFLESGLVSPK